MTRVIAGEFRGRRLATGTGRADGRRPTADRTKTILFDLLGPLGDVDAALDLFAGSGGLGIEALSRGVTHVSFVEHDRREVGVLRRNLATLGVEDRSTVWGRDVYTVLARSDRAWPLVLADPPYGRGELDRLTAALRDRVTGRVVLEHAEDEDPGDAPTGFVRVRRRPVGRTVLSILEPEGRTE